jgi:ankyrin repeat protein
MLIEAKANVNIASESKTPLMAASKYGHLDVVEALIEARADLNTAINGWTALDSACTKPDNHPVVAALIAAGARVDVPQTLDSVLTNVIKYNHSLESLKLFIAAGANVDAKDYDFSPLQSAIAYNNVAAAQILIDAKADVNFTGNKLSTLAYAAYSGRLELTKLFLAAGADVTHRNDKGETCLHAFCEAGHGPGWSFPDEDTSPVLTERLEGAPRDYPGVLRVLLEAKADVGVRAASGETALLVAMRMENYEAAAALLAAGADPNDTGEDGITALNIACRNGSVGAASALIAARADVNHVNRFGHTALVVAGYTNHGSIISALMAAGADVNHVFNGLSLLDLAEARGLNDFSAALVAAGAMRFDELMQRKYVLVGAVCHGDLQGVRRLVHGAGDEEKEAALVLAVRCNFVPIVKCLLAGGASPAIKIADRSILNVACDSGLADMARELIDGGADITAKDEDGMTAMQLAAKNKHRDVVALLLAKANELKKTK